MHQFKDLCFQHLTQMIKMILKVINLLLIMFQNITKRSINIMAKKMMKLKNLLLLIDNHKQQILTLHLLEQMLSNTQQQLMILMMNNRVMEYNQRKQLKFICIEQKNISIYKKLVLQDQNLYKNSILDALLKLFRKKKNRLNKKKI